MEWKRLARIKQLWWIHILIFIIAGIFFTEFCQKNRESLNDEYWRTEQETYVDQYQKNLQDTINRAEYMKGISIFSKEGSYAEKNIEKTEADAQKLLNVIPEVMKTPFIPFWLGSDLGDYLIIVLIFAVLKGFLQERREEMWGLVRLTKNGRGQLLVRRLCLMAVLIAVYVCILFLLRFIICSAVLGIFDQWTAPIQSNAAFAFFAIPCTIAEYVICFLLAKICGYVIIAWLFYGIFCAIRENKFLYLVCGALLIGEWLLKNSIRTNSKLYILNLINIFTIIDIYEITSVYYNLNFMGQAVSSMAVVAAAMGLIGTAAVAWLFILQGRQYPNIQKKKVLKGAAAWKWMKRGKKISAVFMIEGKKIFIFQKGLILLIILGLLQGYRVERQFQYLSREESYLQAYYNMFEGSLDDEAMTLAEREEKKLQAMIDGAEDGDIRRSYAEQKRAFDTVYTEMQRVWIWKQNGENVWLMNPKGYQKLMEMGKDKAVDLSLCISWVVLLSIGSWYMEKRNGMTTILHVTPRGLAYIQRQKIKWMIVYAFFVFAMVFGVEVGNTLYRFPIGGIGASVKSLKWMEGFAGPIWLYLAGQYLLFFVFVCAVLIAGLYIGYFRYFIKKQ